ncbi:MAG: DNA-deoxyinosine glycosylase [Granulosicoccaceae bacterium]
MSSNTPSVQSFPAISQHDAKVLVLGSMPGVASLNEAAYYAHPRNAFWPIAIACFSDTLIGNVDLQQWSYEQRLRLLKDNQVAVWDVLAECVRPGSLDSAIDQKSVTLNPIMEFLDQHASIKRIVFNGKAANAMFSRHVEKAIDGKWASYDVELITMPSTSPAMAQLSLAEKFSVWNKALNVMPTKAG